MGNAPSVMVDPDGGFYVESGMTNPTGEEDPEAERERRRAEVKQAALEAKAYLAAQALALQKAMNGGREDINHSGSNSSNVLYALTGSNFVFTGRAPLPSVSSSSPTVQVRETRRGFVFRTEDGNLTVEEIEGYRYVTLANPAYYNTLKNIFNGSEINYPNRNNIKTAPASGGEVNPIYGMLANVGGGMASLAENAAVRTFVDNIGKTGYNTTKSWIKTANALGKIGVGFNIVGNVVSGINIYNTGVIKGSDMVGFGITALGVGAAVIGGVAAAPVLAPIGLAVGFGQIIFQNYFDKNIPSVRIR
jgi:hypothetical protein